jgi:hypothetical protein
VKKRLGCLHAHYSNIDYIENALRMYDVELIHFVDPALYYRIANDANFRPSDALAKVKEQLAWMAQCDLDAILITCTNYIAVLQDESHVEGLPILKIDEPYFDALCHLSSPQIILFTNPNTVEGTLNRLKEYAHKQGKYLELDAQVLEGTFPLVMQGKMEEYKSEVARGLHKLIQDEPQKGISVAQLSMVDAALQVEQTSSRKIVNPLTALVASVVKQLALETKV